MTAKQTQRTPGPWHVNYRNGAAASMYGHNIASSIYSKPGVTDGRDSIAEVRGGENAETARANVEFIVRACNSHDTLVAALHELIAGVDKWAAGGTDGDLSASCAVARAALAKAEQS